MTPTTLDQITAISDASARHWQPFDALSPGGIPFSGYLCRQESDKLGMLAVTSLDGQERLEFIPAMPKIHYPYIQDRDGRLQVSIPVPINIVDARFTVKLDGTAIIFYPLTAPDGAVLEVIPRTRLLPVLAPSRWGDWHGLLAEALPDRAPVERAVREQHVVLAFELWGLPQSAPDPLRPAAGADAAHGHPPPQAGQLPPFGRHRSALRSRPGSHAGGGCARR